jgi:hypothetical protein
MYNLFFFDKNKCIIFHSTLMESFINYIYNRTITSKHLFIVPYYLIIFLVVRLKYTEVLLGLVFIYTTVQVFLLNCSVTIIVETWNLSS